MIRKILYKMFMYAAYLVRPVPPLQFKILCFAHWGSDENDGSKESPYKTLAKCQEERDKMFNTKCSIIQVDEKIDVDEHEADLDIKQFPVNIPLKEG